MAFNTTLLSTQTKANIYQCWKDGIPPSLVATTLRLAMTTVIAEYLRLDGGM